uniref:Lactate permease n=1 Tax=Aureoumbra lagunensis TaxID=44058 RepID=A0A7S3JXS0_9STRA|mmetsp:Transcript_7922/g.10085  ORF Transcript_7922/g.10085 Transcript_7922/m.10085 type:complete len:629 (+) Transcript_7922:31-1917(+)
MGANGAWDTLVGFLPIILLIVLTFRGWPTRSSLPVSTIALYLTALVWFKFEPNAINASVIKGLGDSLTTICIVFGAICLFEMLKMTGALDWLTGKLRSFSRGNQTAEVMLIAWAFAYLVEGASGFGTPTALAAPLLIEMGYEAKATVACCLVMNTLATPFGAAGTPIWFGLDNLGIDDANLEKIGFWAQVISFTAAHVVPVMAAMHLVPISILQKQIVTLYICIYACSGIALAIATFSYELPTLLGGGIGLVLASFYVKTTNTPDLDEIKDSVRRSIGSSSRSKIRRSDFLSETSTREEAPSNHQGENKRSEVNTESFEEKAPDYFTESEDNEVEFIDLETRTTNNDASENISSTRKSASSSLRKDNSSSSRQKQPTWKYLFPLGMVVFYLTLTRFPIIDIKDELKSQHPRLEFRLGSFGEFWISSALVVGLSEIFRDPTKSTTFEIAYVPGVLPFVVVATFSMYLFDMTNQIPTLLKKTWHRTSAVIIPICSALVLAAIMRAGVAAAIANPIITSFGKIGWIIVTPLFGVLGSFFSGSTTVSNLTFGGVQVIAADRLGLNKLHLLALQSVGATIGNCVCLQNIISAKVVVGLDTLESEFIKVTWKPAAIFVAFAWAWGFILFATASS